jgi:hypothetical protein
MTVAVEASGVDEFEGLMSHNIVAGEASKFASRALIQ